MSETIIEVRHFFRRHSEVAIPFFGILDFTVRGGDVTSIIGASGSGKSTVRRCTSPAGASLCR